MEETLKTALELLTHVTRGGYKGQGGVYRDNLLGPTCIHCGASSRVIPFGHDPKCMMLGIQYFLATAKCDEG